MGTSPTRNFRYPETSDSPTIPAHFRNLAEDLDAFLALTTATVSYGTNVAAANSQGARLYKTGGVVYFTAEIVTSAAIASNAILLTIPTGFRPATRIPTEAVTFANAAVACLIESAGTMRLPNSGAASGTTLFISDTWPAA